MFPNYQEEMQKLMDLYQSIIKSQQKEIESLEGRIGILNLLVEKQAESIEILKIMSSNEQAKFNQVVRM